MSGGITHPGQRGTTSGVMYEVSDDALDVAIALC